MKSAIYMDGKRFVETEFKTKEDFERIAKELHLWKSSARS